MLPAGQALANSGQIRQVALRSALRAGKRRELNGSSSGVAKERSSGTTNLQTRAKLKRPTHTP